VKNIRRKILEELSLDLNIVVSKDRVQKEENFLDTKVLEEKVISANIIKNTSIQPRLDLPRGANKNYKFGKTIRGNLMNIRDINLQTGSCTIEGEVFQLETRQIRNNNTLVTFNISDGTDSITAKVFLTKEQ